MPPLSLVAVAVAAATTGCAPPLAPRLHPFPNGSIKPRGWVLRQLLLQTDGLSGHLPFFWPDIKDSAWIGGSEDVRLHERTPYWLNGVVPLAALMEQAGITAVPDTNHNGPDAHRGTRFTGNRERAPIQLVEQVDRYVNYIIDHANDDGWLGPQPADRLDAEQFWGPAPLLLALTQWAEWKDDGTQLTDAWQRATSAMLAHMLEMNRRIDEGARLRTWSRPRWVELALTAQWLLDFAPQGEEVALMDLLRKLQRDGSEWERFFDSPALNIGDGWLLHNVNLAQGLKSAAVSQRFMPGATVLNRTWEEHSKRRMAKLDALNGLPTGMYNGDEYIPTGNSRHPSRGIELCGVVEAMWSYTTMYAVHGTLAFLDRVENIAFNALPATWSSPKGGDMWAHQYIQAVNEINAIKVEDHLWEHDGPDAETYGLEPNYGCCTANFNQGWPKFAAHAFFTTPDDDVVVAFFIPVEGRSPQGDVVRVDTEYPFNDVVTITVTPSLSASRASMRLLLRIPGWAKQATVNDVPVPGGTYHTVDLRAPTTLHVQLRPSVRVSEWDGGAVAVHHGALMYSLPIKPEWNVTARHYGDQCNDYSVEPGSAWNYALDVDLHDPEGKLHFVRLRDPNDVPAPFNHTGWATGVKATVRTLPWDIKRNSADRPPTSPACTGGSECGAATEVLLVPHGGTVLRIGEFPRTGL